ncbi:hypothetical protein QOZ80_8BG0645640 [Eleusine coracana subsp. coracana]|nr:hypothetical protein QOZ80_8BG0645640 [Eleusine coracana subsp. coracana]
MSTLALLLSLLLRIFATQPAPAAVATDAAAMISSSFTACLSDAGVSNVTPRGSPAYDAALRVSVQNLRFAGPTSPKPAAVVVPSSLSDLRAAVLCSRASGLAVRLRSGGHSYEGLSYTSTSSDTTSPFAVVDLALLAAVHVDPATRTAWVEAGATLGQVYHAVAAAASASGGDDETLAFSAGSCPTVGAGGHVAGGGFGLLSRKHGLAADNVVDAVVVAADGRVLDRAGMGEDVFWAVRGGGGGGWAAVYAWQVRLNPVPPRVTAFVVNRAAPPAGGPGSVEQVARLVSTWQHVAPWLPDAFYLSAFVGAGLPERQNQTGSIISVTFKGLYLGPKHEALKILEARFPEIGLSADLNPVEMTWIESVVFFSGLPDGSTVSDLTDRVLHTKKYFKAKSDYVRRPMPLDGLLQAVELLAKQPKAYVIMDPYGGAMDRVGSADLPFPHRKGNIHGVQYMIEWTAEDEEEEYMEWLRRFYDFMGPYVSNSPRAAYINYMDLDLGTNNWSSSWIDDGGDGDSSPNPEVEAARVWGERYFLGNYDRLVRAKTLIDPDNVFRNAQSIPPLGRRRPTRVVATKSPRGSTIATKVITSNNGSTSHADS